LGKALFEKGQLDEGLAELQEAVRLKRDSATAHYDLGRALGVVAVRLKRDSAIAHHDLGRALGVKDLLDQVIAEYREAIRIKEDFAEAHCNLGQVLHDQGHFAEALVALKRGHELGSRQPKWPYPSAEWVRQCEQRVQLEAKLPKVLSGEVEPPDVNECLGLAAICLQPKKLNRAAYRFFTDAFDKQPKLAEDMRAQHRYNAACAAALAGCGQGKDADQTDEKERARLRRQAITWLRADLAAWRQLLDKEPVKMRAVVQKTMQHWQQDNDFAGVRGPEALSKLPEDERQDWQKLWQEAEALRKSAQEPPK
jgi:serine/threonine-protein kinase